MCFCVRRHRLAGSPCAAMRRCSRGGVRPAGTSREHDTHQLHAIAPGLVGQTIERARRLPKGCVSPALAPRPWRLHVDHSSLGVADNRQPYRKSRAQTLALLGGHARSWIRAAGFWLPASCSDTSTFVRPMAGRKPTHEAGRLPLCPLWSTYGRERVWIAGGGWPGSGLLLGTTAMGAAAARSTAAASLNGVGDVSVGSR